MMAGEPNPKPTRDGSTVLVRRLPAQSAKRQSIGAERTAFVRQMLTCVPFCQFGVGGLQCGQRSAEVHEIVMRSAGGPIVPSQGLTPEGCRALCSFHHRWIHDHPAAATALGYLARTVLA